MALRLIMSYKCLIMYYKRMICLKLLILLSDRCFNMGNSFLDSYKNRAEKKQKKRGEKSILVSIRLPPDVHNKLKELSDKDASLTKTVVKALRYALDMPE